MKLTGLTLANHIVPSARFAGVGLALAISCTGWAQASYTVTPITRPPTLNQGNAKMRLNEGGQISGATVDPSTGRYVGYKWSPDSPNGTTGSIAYLGTFSTYDFTEAYGLNNLGDVVGRAADSVQNIRMKPPRALYWPVGGGVLDIAVSSAQTEGYAINDSREILLQEYKSGLSTSGTNVAKLINGKWKINFLGPGWPQDINNSGQVLSTYEGADVPLFTPTDATHTKWSKQIIMSNASAYDLNEKGEVVGSSPRNSSLNHPMLFLPAASYGLSAGVNDLWGAIYAALPTPDVSGAIWRNGMATALNDNGVVIGQADAQVWNATYSRWETAQRYVWIWDAAHGARLFQDLLTGTGWSLRPSVGNASAGEVQTCGYWSINNAGQIVCEASNDGGLTYQTVLLTPVPGP